MMYFVYVRSLWYKFQARTDLYIMPLQICKFNMRVQLKDMINLMRYKLYIVKSFSCSKSYFYNSGVSRDHRNRSANGQIKNVDSFIILNFYRSNVLCFFIFFGLNIIKFRRSDVLFIAQLSYHFAQMSIVAVNVVLKFQLYKP